MRSTKALALGLFSLLTLVSGTSYAADTLYKVTVTNLTFGQGWGKPLLYTHDASVVVFQEGVAASPELRALAEEGDNLPLATALEGNPAVKQVVKGEDPLMPGDSMTFEIMADETHPMITLAAMLGSTNDTFAAVPSLALTGQAQVVDGGAWDAGTEVNNESCAYIPGPPCGSTMAPLAEGSEGVVTPSTNVKGIGDLPAQKFAWSTAPIHVVIVPVVP